MEVKPDISDIRPNELAGIEELLAGLKAFNDGPRRGTSGCSRIIYRTFYLTLNYLDVRFCSSILIIFDSLRVCEK